MPLRNVKSGNGFSRTTITPALRVVKPITKALAKHTETNNISIDLKRSKEYKSILQQIQRQFGHKENTLMPTDLKPMLASLTDKPFDGKGWQFEIKWDGYRTLAYVMQGNVQLCSRNNLSFNSKYPAIITALKEWPLNAVLDGEIVVLTEDGKADFGALQNWHIRERGKLVFYVFDLLWIEGIDLTKEPLKVRREVLKKILPDSDNI